MAELHVVVLWAHAARVADRIRHDLAARLELLEAVSLDWAPERFERNLHQFYGWELPDVALKSGGPPLALVVRDPHPEYAPRPRSWGSGAVNVHLYDAKHRYRAWAGGAFAVHASNDAREARRDVYMLLGRTAESYAGTTSVDWATPPARAAGDPPGAHGWSSLRELTTALDLAAEAVRLGEPADGAPLELLTPQPAVARLLLGRPGADGVTQVEVAGRSVAVRVRHPGDGLLDPRWAGAVLREAVPAAGGGRIAAAEHRALIALHRQAHGDPAALPALLADDRARATLPPGDLGDAHLARVLVDDFLRRNGWVVRSRRRQQVTPRRGWRRAPARFIVRLARWIVTSRAGDVRPTTPSADQPVQDRINERDATVGGK